MKSATIGRGARTHPTIALHLETAVGMASPSGKYCHAGQLLNLSCRVDASSWKRCCASCLERYAASDLILPVERCRLLAEPIGVFSKARSFYVRWKTDSSSVFDVKQLHLVGSSVQLLIFPSEAEAAVASTRVPSLLTPKEPVRLRLCATAKTFCPASNFSAGTWYKSCRMHGGAASSCEDQCPPCTSTAIALPSLTPLQPAGLAGLLPLQSVGPTSLPPAAALSTAPQPSSAVKRPRMTAAVPEEQEDDDDFPELAAYFNDGAFCEPSGALWPPPPPPSLAASNNGATGAATCSSASAAGSAGSHHTSPEHDNTGSSPLRHSSPEDGGDPRGVQSSQNGSFSNKSAGSSTQNPMAGAPPPSTPSYGIAGFNGPPPPPPPQPLLGGPPQQQPQLHSTMSEMTPLPSVEVRGTLLAHGETLKMGGSSQWTVVSDGRLKEVVAKFDLGAGDLFELTPKVFRYNGLGGTDPNGTLYAGLIAQEVPERLAQYCRKRAWVKLRPDDDEKTEIFVLDHSCLPLVCINAINEHEGRLQDFGKLLEATGSQIETLQNAVDRHEQQLSVLPPLGGSFECEQGAVGSETDYELHKYLERNRTRSCRSRLPRLTLLLLSIIVISAAVAAGVSMLTHPGKSPHGGPESIPMIPIIASHNWINVGQWPPPAPPPLPPSIPHPSFPDPSNQKHLGWVGITTPGTQLEPEMDRLKYWWRDTTDVFIDECEVAGHWGMIGLPGGVHDLSNRSKWNMVAGKLGGEFELRTPSQSLWTCFAYSSGPEKLVLMVRFALNIDAPCRPYLQQGTNIVGCPIYARLFDASYTMLPPAYPYEWPSIMDYNEVWRNRRTYVDLCDEGDGDCVQRGAGIRSLTYRKLMGLGDQEGRYPNSHQHCSPTAGCGGGGTYNSTDLPPPNVTIERIMEELREKDELRAQEAKAPSPPPPKGKIVHIRTGWG